MILNLPYPPSVNNYTAVFRGRKILSARGREYQTEVMANILQNGRPQTIKGRVRVQIEASPPDRRQRDIDNIVKPILDSLQKAAVFENDSQIDDLRILRGPVVEHGEALVIVEEIQPLVSEP